MPACHFEAAARKKVKATFFLGGQWVEKFPELAQDVARDFEVGSHGYAHREPSRLSVADNLAEIRRAEAIIESVTKKRPRLFAPLTVIVALLFSKRRPRLATG
ncbi:polysaccharide deacetylase family protein [Thermodesulfitimonas sp.]